MQTILLIFGGISPEHEVAIVTAIQVGQALKKAGFKVLPTYISKSGHWYLGGDSFLDPKNFIDPNFVEKNGKKFVLTPDRSIKFIQKSTLGYKPSSLNIDVVFPVFHGRNGEDGSIAGLLNLTNIPYVGCGLIASALAIDKYLTKKVAKSIGINVVDDVLINKSAWQQDQEQFIPHIKKLGKTLFVKPATLGSSIGITKTDSLEKTIDAINVALNYDNRCLVEKAIDNPIEVNISLLGNNPYQFSITEQPVLKSQILSFQDKYLGSSGGKTKKISKQAGMASADRYMPAKVGKKTIKSIQDQATIFFSAIGGRGISRLDFMVDSKGKIYLNELNNLPGSLSFYLWQKTGLPFPDLVKKLVNLALDYHRTKQSLISSFDSNILQTFLTNSSGSKTGNSN